MDISRIAKQRFSYQDIMELDPDMTYARLSEVISRLCEAGTIVPVKNSGKTSFRPPVYREYKKVRLKPDYSRYMAEIGSLHPRLAISRYMGKPEEFVDNRAEILQLSGYLWNHGGCPVEVMSVKERSYDIWKDEKFLESRSGHRVMSFNGLKEQELNCYYAPEPFFCTRTGSEGLVLVIENKDPWYSIGKALKQSGQGWFCGLPVSMLVYGEGNKVTRDGALKQFVLEECGGKDVKIGYAGDIDGAGVEILYRGREHNPGLEIEPFRPLYEAMAERAARQMEAGFPLQESKDERNLAWNRDFLELFAGTGGKDNRRLVETVLDENRLIPQEILSYQDYKTMCGTKMVMDVRECEEGHV